MLTEVPGVRVGHWTDPHARTGCTVTLFPSGTVASVEVRGGAPASRELELLAPARTLRHIDALLLTGGSAFGLAAADGVMRYCEEREMGVETPGGVVPIVPSLGLFDLAVGRPERPGAREGYQACSIASDGPVQLGAVGAGTGATTGNWRGPANRRPGGLVGATLRSRSGELIVSALVAVNAYGDVDGDGSGTAAALGALDSGLATLEPESLLTNTTIGAVVTNALLEKVECLVVAQGAHDGLSRSLVPVHTRLDGDAFVAAATGEVESTVDAVRFMAAAAVEQAVRSCAPH